MTIPAMPSGDLIVDLVVGEREAVSDQLVALSPALCSILQPSTSKQASTTTTTPVAEKISISLRPTSNRTLGISSIPSLAIYAVKSTHETSGLWIEASKAVASILNASSRSHRSDKGRQVLVEKLTLFDASLVYLQATSQTSYDNADSSQDELVRQLDGKVLRQGQIIRLQLGATVVPLRVAMLEPLLQGVFSADKSDVLLTLQSGAAEEDGLEQSMVSSASEDSFSIAGSETEAGADEKGDSGDEVGDEDDLEIDERFLAQTVLEDFSNLEISIDPASTAKADGQRSKESKVKRCSLHQLQDPSSITAAISHWFAQASSTESNSLMGSASDNIDEENVILASERDMASLGAFNGDWVAASPDTNPSSTRLVRIFSSQDLPHSSSSSRSLGVHMSPILAQNILRDAVFSPSSTANASSLILRILGSCPSDTQPEVSALVRSCPVPIPFAESLRIARVAGPLSVDRAYQGLFLEALRTFFEDRRRICRNGDLIAVAIEASKARFVAREAEQDAPDAENDDIHDLELPSSSSAKTATVYFKVTDLRSELVAPDAATNGKTARDEATRALSLQGRMGQLGCIVDPHVTNMVQTGVEHCRVVDCDRWLGVYSDTPTLPSHFTNPEQQKLVAPLVAPSSPYATLSSLLNATLQPNASRFNLHLSVLLKGARGCGKRTVTRWVAKSAGVQLVELDCFDVISDTDVRTEGMLRARFSKAAECAPCIFLLRNIEALARKSQALETGQEPPLATALASCFEELWSVRGTMPVAVFGTASEPDKCPSGVLGYFKHEVTFGAPNEAERRAMLEITMQGSVLGPDVELKGLATQTAALVAADLVNLASRSRLASVSRVRKAPPSSASSVVSDRDLFLGGLAITGEDLDAALNKARSSYSESIGAPKIPNVTWDDVGGLAAVKSDILDTIQLPLEHPELFSDGLKKRSGILLYGPPGTGKTLLAKAVATSCSLNFFSVKGPELLNMYIGESEANVRRVFQRARDAKPCVIFFDELDSVAPKRGNQGDSGGVMDRIVSQLLAELDGMAGSSEGTDVFVIGATNRPDLLDPALLRPGRFDRMLYLSVSETHAAQLNILQALTRKFKLDPDVGDLSCIADQCPFNLTGADFYALCSDAMLKAMTRKASEVDARIEEINKEGGRKGHPHPITAQYYLAEMAKAEEIEVKVNRRDFEGALRELTPSVSEQEMEHYREVQAKFSAPKKEKGGEAEGEKKGKGKGKGKGVMGEEQLMAMMKAARNGNGVVSRDVLSQQAAAEDGMKGRNEEEQEEQEEVAAEARRKAKGKGKASS
ncbi:hypothetical protein NDA11_003913 [Ustilago hordei]|uniref:Peroxisomal ATPase PEX6 n=1 Tax=Ustilago hordei TaxID=120017 RepID=I2FM99_USTHO|nr:uncharacterized protein UHO2_01514 [Ustilago hordei]KAJ1044828.1 hypothetical protein NDA10_001361 [Ustilago hordei]KAJ1583385.1 hypothetical protein NDA15_003005 [Ustilago hordei]KAJ1586666.1 hypothetical protein NDA11_003913 [Ustilago hordei]KAJ1592239.1 hypothetical protein NDA12_006785 [Ustilago hordei]UTT94559.1 hypothetical protein NDA17_005356 [Ustilago hordei]